LIIRLEGVAVIKRSTFRPLILKKKDIYF